MNGFHKFVIEHAFIDDVNIISDHLRKIPDDADNIDTIKGIFSKYLKRQSRELKSACNFLDSCSNIEDLDQFLRMRTCRQIWVQIKYLERERYAIKKLSKTKQKEVAK